METRGGLYFPVKLRCVDNAALLASDGLVDALARALGRAFKTAQSALPAAIASGEGIALQDPELIRGELDDSQRADLLNRVRSAINQAARSRDLRVIVRAIDRTSLAADALPTAPAESQPRPSEVFDPARFDPKTAEYELPSYKGGTKKVPLSNKATPFNHLIKTFYFNIQLLKDLIAQQNALTVSNSKRIDQMIALRLALSDLETERSATLKVADVYAGRLKAEDVTGTEREIADRVVSQYYTAGKPFPDGERIAYRESELERGAVLLNIVRVRVNAFDAEATKRTSDEEEQARDGFLDVGTYYLELLTILQSEAFERLAFLDAYYADTDVILAFAVVRYIREQLPVLWENLRLGSGSFVLRENIRDANAPTDASGNTADRAAAIAIQDAVELQNDINDKEGWSKFGQLPKTSGGMRQFPDRRLAASLAARIVRLQVEIPLVRLLDFRQRLSDAMAHEEYVGVSLFEASLKGDKDRQQWFKELHDLLDAFTAEWAQTRHPDFGKKIEAWEDQLRRLHGLIYKEIRNLAIRRMIGEQLPFLFVGVGVAAGVGAWVARIASGARWLVILAEATTLTAINLAGSSAATGKAPTAGDVVIQFGTNLALAGFGQVFRVLGASLEAAEGLSAMRRVLLLATLKAGAFASTTLVQTAVQALEAHANAQGGESSFTEMLTLNLIMNGLGALLGAALHIEPAAAGGKSLVLSSPAQIVAEWASRGVHIDEPTAQEWLKLANRSSDFEARYQRIVHAAREGKLTPEEFQRFREDGLALLDELTEKLPRFAKFISSERTPEEIIAGLKVLRGRLERLTFSPRVLLLPEYTDGLVHVAEGPTWTYDPARPPRRLAALRASLEERGLTLRELPGGGFEATNAEGKVVLQALPLAASARGALTRPIEDIVRGPLAQEGLNRVRTQTAVPELPARLAQIAQTNPKSVTRILQILGRGQAIHSDEAFSGVNNYLKNGGRPRTLARAVTIAGDKAGNYATSLFEGMSSWGAQQVAGLELIYEIRPRTTGEQIGRLLGDFSPDEVKSILSDLATLGPVSRASGLRRVIGHLVVERILPETYRPGQSALASKQVGGRGVLYSAIELLKRFPGKSISFEETEFTPAGRQRIEDIVIIDPATQRRIAGFENKEVRSQFLGRDAATELAKDITLDAARARAAAAGGSPRQPFDSFGWRVRRFELQAEATKALVASGVANPTPAQIDGQMRSMIRESLKGAFNDPEVLALPKQTQAAYRASFEQSLPFVEFY